MLQKNVLYELNGESALKVYERFLGKHAQGLPEVGVEYPLGIVGPCPDGTDDNYCLLRAATSVNRNDGSLHLGGEIPEGSKVYMTCGDISSILDATRNAARIAKEGLNDTPPRMVFFYSYMARKILLGLRINEEFALIREQFGHNVPIVGFYSYGEYCQAGCGGPLSFKQRKCCCTGTGMLRRTSDSCDYPPRTKISSLLTRRHFYHWRSMATGFDSCIPAST